MVIMKTGVITLTLLNKATVTMMTTYLVLKKRTVIIYIHCMRKRDQGRGGKKGKSVDTRLFIMLCTCFYLCC